MQNELGAKLRELRDAKGVSRRQMAEDLDVHLQTVLRWEAATRKISIEWLERLAAYFGTTSAELLGEVNGVSPPAVAQALPVVNWDYKEVGREPVFATAPDADSVLRAVLIEEGSMGRVAPPGSVIIFDETDTRPRDGHYYAGVHAGVPAFRRYYARPERFESLPAVGDTETLLPDEFTVLGRVLRVIQDL